MNTLNEKAIELSKNKLVLLVLGSCMLVALGYWMVQMDSAEIEARRRFNTPWFIHGIGTISILFFGLCGVFGVRKIFDKTLGLVFNENGIYDNSSGVAAGLIPWPEILGFGVYEIQKQKMLIVRVVSPEKYIAIGNPVRRTLNKMNHKICGSPIAISSNTLRISFEELQEIFGQYLKKYGRSA